MIYAVDPKAGTVQLALKEKPARAKPAKEGR
jgi:hypothetical protein